MLGLQRPAVRPDRVGVRWGTLPLGKAVAQPEELLPCGEHTKEGRWLFCPRKRAFDYFPIQINGDPLPVWGE